MNNIEKITLDSIKAVGSLQSPVSQTHTRQEKIMGGNGTITIVGGTQKLIDDSWQLLHECENLWSRFLATSELTQLNQAEGEPVIVSSHTLRLLREMIDGYRLTEGSYNPTLLLDLIKTGYSASAVNSQLAPPLPQSAQSPGDLLGIEFFSDRVRLPLGTVLDPGGIGKGLAADIVSEFAITSGASGVMVEVGGDIVVRGTAPDGVCWNLGIEDPFDAMQKIGVIRINSGAVATSSQRKKRFGNKHHLLNTVTRSSADTEVQTVTVLAATGAQAEVLTKRGFTEKPHEYLSWINHLGAEGMLVMSDGSQLVTQGWNKFQ